jgi:hypothetical protein
MRRYRAAKANKHAPLRVAKISSRIVLILM